MYNLLCENISFRRNQCDTLPWSLLSRVTYGGQLFTATYICGPPTNNLHRSNFSIDHWSVIDLATDGCGGIVMAAHLQLTRDLTAFPGNRPSLKLRKKNFSRINTKTRQCCRLYL